ncbi:MAG: ATP-dependent Clp protease proteolytic subunit [Opitutaceae bacterium]|nr:ATP-dependent Clp protease proteolytic subunit [Opitutaceae bacterium]
MPKWIPPLLFLLALLSLGAVEPVVPGGGAAPVPNKEKTTVYVIPVRTEIARPVFYMLRRGLKEAIDHKAGVVVLDMQTPGGALDVTLEIMEALGKFPGDTITFVNKEAMSAGAFIAASTKEIYFVPEGVIGAAEPVTSTGQEVDASMKRKITSYLKARIRATTEGKGYRGQVISAMMDPDYELKIGDAVIKSKGELLSLTATEASKTYGEPAQPLLAAGIAKDIDDLLGKKFGSDGYQMVNFRVTWSEDLAVWLNTITPILLGLGLLALFIEFKTPGFGLFGISGIVLLAIVFLSQYVAGLSGHEPALFFALGLLILGLEVFFFPGMVLPALLGVVLMLGALLWSMADIWPDQPITIAGSGDLFLRPLLNLGAGVGLALLLALILIRYLPREWFWDKLVLHGSVGTAAQLAGQAPEAADGVDALTGAEGVAVTGLFPSGEVEIFGRRYQARIDLGSAQAGTPVVVKGRTDFGLLVERKLS